MGCHDVVSDRMNTYRYCLELSTDSLIHSAVVFPFQEVPGRTDPAYFP